MEPATGHTRLVTIGQAYFHAARIAQLATVITASARRIAMPNGRCRLHVRPTSHMICPLEPGGRVMLSSGRTPCPGRRALGIAPIIPNNAIKSGQKWGVAPLALSSVPTRSSRAFKR
jgi:hypothetical protein